ncbi:MAG: hypothetical protein IJT80_10400 [Lachnospiraceae bacterium]|nr:hypothetical protein [Lachnospiraceae bacterium]
MPLDLRSTSQISAAINAGQPADNMASLSGSGIAAISWPTPIRGRAGMKEAISPRIMISTTTGLPHIGNHI